ncbi:PorT family protein [Dokdonia sinensis]|uniref:PorT family protein n=1 Tax=Dokdonia sinensis TaxID=2479847 RepID=A0A3M0G6P5_9FLAO|nr:porin family protein [Dokdonia sinensis]RMB60605.1 PorT family protein [Dokdonia sinensis]
MKIFIVTVMLLSGITAFGQNSSFGIKGGLNYGATGDLTTFSIFGDGKIDSENKAGYHFGIFGKIEFSGIFLQPELVYTKLNSGFEDNDLDARYDIRKIDLPVLVGIHILGPLNIKAGPSLQYILDDEFEANTDSFDLEDPENDVTVGYQIGAGLDLGKLEIDLRYEGAFQENEVVSSTEVQDAGFRIDTRPKQWIISLSYKFGN